jgi:hypothetical protein
MPAAAPDGAAGSLSADEEEKLRAILAENEGDPPGRD